VNATVQTQRRAALQRLGLLSSHGSKCDIVGHRERIEVRGHVHAPRETRFTTGAILRHRGPCIQSSSQSQVTQVQRHQSMLTCSGTHVLCHAIKCAVSWHVCCMSGMYTFACSTEPSFHPRITSVSHTYASNRLRPVTDELTLLKPCHVTAHATSVPTHAVQSSAVTPKRSLAFAYGNV
jgi:hypothetical protein